MTHVLVTAPFPERFIDKLKAVSDKLTVEQYRLPAGEWPAGKTTQAEVFYAIEDIPPPDLAPNLKWVQTHWAGIEHLHEHPVWNTSITITTASGVHAVNMAEYAMTQLLVWAHRVPNWFTYQAKSTWPKSRWDKYVPAELRGATLGILGYGSIGRELARLAKSFGMKVLVTKRDLLSIEDKGWTVSGVGDSTGLLPDRLYPGEATFSMIAECDYIVVTLPLTDTTRHLIDERMLRQMKPNCFLVNIGRGGLIDEKALIKALKKGWIAGAGLDVFAQEPLPNDSPLWQLDNLILTPHISGFTPHYDERVTDIFAENLRRYLVGDPLINLVDRDETY